MCRLAAELGVIGDECGCACICGDGIIGGGGGGCVVFDVRTCSPSCISSIEAITWLPFISLSITAWPVSFGVSASELGGDTNEPGSMPSIGKVWLRGRCAESPVLEAETEETRLGSWLPREM